MRLTNTLAILGMAGFIAGVTNEFSPANAKPHRSAERHAQSRPAGTPRLAVIALAQQHVSIYDDSGKILAAPVSTGATGRETPAGIYTIVQKEEEHHSNLYDDASMPYMQRLTWTGISMHAGSLPGYPASHGCTRLPYGFAQQLYQLTEPGMRVVIVREDIAPVEVQQPAMFTRPHASALEIDGQPTGAEMRARLRSIAETKSAEAQTAMKRQLEARSAAASKAAEAKLAVSRDRDGQGLSRSGGGEIESRGVCAGDSGFARTQGKGRSRQGSGRRKHRSRASAARGGDGAGAGWNERCRAGPGRGEGRHRPR